MLIPSLESLVAAILVMNYVWAGLWLYRDMTRNDPVSNESDLFERAVVVITVLFWPIIAFFCPRWEESE